MYLGSVGVDSGQLLISDPCYIESQWLDEPSKLEVIYRDVETGQTLTRGRDFGRFDQLLESYDGACQATSSPEGYGELCFRKGHSGAGVAFGSGWGDGFYPVFGEKHDGRIVRVYVNTGAEPAPLVD